MVQKCTKQRQTKSGVITVFSWKLRQPNVAHDAIEYEGDEYKLDIWNMRCRMLSFCLFLRCSASLRPRAVSPHDFDSVYKLRTSCLLPGVALILEVYGLNWFICVGGRLLCGEGYRRVFGWNKILLILIRVLSLWVPQMLQHFVNMPANCFDIALWMKQACNLSFFGPVTRKISPVSAISTISADWIFFWSGIEVNWYT